MSQKQRRVTSLDEIRAQAEPDIIKIPGFKPGTTINVAVQPVDLTAPMLETGIGNPLLAVVEQKTRELRGRAPGEAVKEIRAAVEEAAKQEEFRVEDILPAIDAICKEALVEPTWDDIIAIRPLTLEQKLAIFDYATGGAEALIPFREE